MQSEASTKRKITIEVKEMYHKFNPVRKVKVLFRQLTALG